MSSGESTTTPFTIALVQMNPRLADLDGNRQVMRSRLIEAANAGAKLIVFPECALSGYVFNDIESAEEASEEFDGATLEMFRTLCAEKDVCVVAGMLEKDVENGEEIYNSALIVSSDGLETVYRKCHLPVLGVDRYVSPGDELFVEELPFCKIGVLICYDMRFPEAARILALEEADVIIVPTNWPQGADSAPEFLTRARAWENRVYVAACDRVGIENGTTFIGRSQVVSPLSRWANRRLRFSISVSNCCKA